jgi:hypothetical protein
VQINRQESRWLRLNEWISTLLFGLSPTQNDLVFMNALEEKVGEIVDEETILLIKELTEVTHVNSDEFRDYAILGFLQQAIYSNRDSDPIPIGKDEMDSKDPWNTYVLQRKVGKLEDHLHQICTELARISGKSIDDFSGTKLHVFLWKVIVPKKARAKPRRWLRNF